MIYLKYSGSVPDKKIIRELEEEFIDIAQISGWDHEIVTENFHTLTSRSKRGGPSGREEFDDLDDEELLTLSSADVHLEGIVLKLDNDMDPLKLTFDKNGRLATISFCTTDTAGFNKKFTVKKYEFLYYPYIKIYSVDVENHIRMVKILDYLKKKYIHDLEVIDTSFYWDNRDEEELRVRIWKANKKGNLKSEI